MPPSPRNACTAAAIAALTLCATIQVPADHATGRVTSKTANTIVLENRRGTVTVHLDGDTTYHVRGVENATLASITVDMRVAVSGRARADGSIDADRVGGKAPRERDAKPTPTPTG